MIVCKKCGGQNPEGTDFCGSCGTFLEWSGERVQEQPRPRESPPPTTAPPPTFVEKVKQAVGIEAPPPASRPEPPQAARAEAAGAPVAGAPPIEAIPPSRQPEAAQPPAKRPVPQEPPARAQPGDLICGQCGTPNDPRRRFCRRCGDSLAEAVVVRTPWWRRLRPARRPPAAGERPAGLGDHHPGGGSAKLARGLVALVLAAAILAYALLPGLRQNVNDHALSVYREARVRLGIGSVEPVRPLRATATSSLPGHSPDLLIDLVKNDYWAADLAQDPQPKITVTFGPPTDLNDLVVTTGAASDYLKLGRPRDVLVTYSDGTTQQLTFKDDAKPVTYGLHGRNVTWLSIQVLTVYPSAQGGAVAIAELEFFRLQ